jgi:hypothetical protein
MIETLGTRWDRHGHGGAPPLHYRNLDMDEPVLDRRGTKFYAFAEEAYQWSAAKRCVPPAAFATQPKIGAVLKLLARKHGVTAPDAAAKCLGRADGCGGGQSWRIPNLSIECRSLRLSDWNFLRGIDPFQSTSVAMDRNWAVVHLDPVNHTGGKSVAKSDRSVAILTGDNEIPVSRLDVWHSDDHSR